MPLKRKWTHPNDKDGKVHSSQMGLNDDEYAEQQSVSPSRPTISYDHLLF